MGIFRVLAIKTRTHAEVAVPAPEPATETAGDRLRRAIKAAGTVQFIADRSGVPKGTINVYLAGGEMKFSNAIALAAATGVTLDWLATGAGPMKPGEPANPQETAPQRPISLWRDTNMDSLITAYSAAVQALLAAGKDETDPPSVMRLTAIMYDQLTGDADK